MKDTNELPSPSTRRKHYLKAIEILSNNLKEVIVYRYGLCLILGDIYSGNYLSSPWIYFDGLVEYYPELKKPYTDWNSRDYGYRVSAIQERIDILTAAVAALDKKLSYEKC